MLRWRLQTTSSASSGDALDEGACLALKGASAGRFLGDGSTEVDEVFGDVVEEYLFLPFVLAEDEDGESP